MMDQQHQLQYSGEHGGISDQALTALAMAADPNVAIDPDATPWSPVSGFVEYDLPHWYMPRAIATVRSRGARTMVVSIIGGILLINACGLCITSGFLSLA